MGFPGGSVGKRIHLQCRRCTGSIPGSGRSPEDIATHSSISAWRIPWTQEPGMIQPTGSQRVGHMSTHARHYIACFMFESESEVAQSCPTLCDPINHSTLGLPVHHQLPQFTQTHAHWISDAIQPSHPLSTPSPPAPNPSQHQGLFQWVNSSHEVARVLEFQLQHQSFQWTPRTDLLQDGLVGSPCNPRDSQESSPTPQFKSINFLVLSFLQSPTLTSIRDHWKNHSLD